MVKEEELISDLNEGITRGLKAKAPGAGMIWNSISGSTGSAWRDALQSAIWDLQAKGYIITKREP